MSEFPFNFVSRYARRRILLLTTYFRSRAKPRITGKVYIDAPPSLVVFVVSFVS